MSKMSQILDAANKTSEYIDLMRLPKANQAITKYASLSFRNGKPVLQNTGFTMLSPKQSTIDKTVSMASGYIFGPLVLANGVLQKLKSEGKGPIRRGMDYGMIATGAILTSFGIYKSLCYSKSETLVFPKTPGKLLKG